MTPLSATTVLLLLAGLQFKHMICDGPAQTPWMIAGKSIYGATPGLVHAAIHVLGSFLAFWFMSVGLLTALVLAVADGVLHYHVDFVKETTVWRLGLTNRDRLFWWLLALDQGLHHFSYIGFIAILIHLAS